MTLRGLGVGHRVIRASARDRAPEVLGTVLELEHGLVRVGFEDGHDALVHPSLLRDLGDTGCPDALAEWEEMHSAR